MPNNIIPTLAVTPSGCGKKCFINVRTEVHTNVLLCLFGKTLISTFYLFESKYVDGPLAVRRPMDVILHLGQKVLARAVRS